MSGPSDPATAPKASSSDACLWLKPIQPTHGFEWRWSDAEKQQVLAFNLNYKAICQGEGVLPFAGN